MGRIDFNAINASFPRLSDEEKVVLLAAEAAQEQSINTLDDARAACASVPEPLRHVAAAVALLGRRARWTNANEIHAQEAIRAARAAGLSMNRWRRLADYVAVIDRLPTKPGKPDERVYYMPTGERERLAVYVGDPEVGIPLIDIADEDCTSPNRETVTPATSATRVCMTRESAAWLRDVLLSLDLGPAPQAVVTDIGRREAAEHPGGLVLVLVLEDGRTWRPRGRRKRPSS